MRKFHLCKRGLTGVEVLIGLAVFGLGAYGINKVTSAFESQGKLEQSVENIEVHQERQNLRIKKANEYDVQQVKKDHTLRQKLRKLKDPKKRARAVFDSIESN